MARHELIQIIAQAAHIHIAWHGDSNINCYWSCSTLKSFQNISEDISDFSIFDDIVVTKMSFIVF